MRKIIREAKVQYICDNCGLVNPEWGMFASVRFSFGYTSKLDGLYGEWDFCPDCAEKFYLFFKKKYPKFELVDNFHR